MSLSAEDAAKLGGSDLSALLGLSQWGTPLTIYARVVSALEGRSMVDADDAQKRRGRHLEGAVLRLYAEETGATVEESVRLTHPRLPYGRASLDGVALRDNLYRVVEVKTAGMSEVRQWGEAGTDQVPQSYLFQCSWYAGVARGCGQTDVDDVDLAALVAGDLRVYALPFDAELFALLEGAVERFWTDHVLPRRPPPVSEPSMDVGAAGVLYPRHKGEARDWSACATEEQVAVREWLLAKREREAAERNEKTWEARVKLMLATTPGIKSLPADTGCRRLDWRQNKPSAVTDWRAVAERLREHVTTSRYAEIVGESTTTKEGARPLKAYALKEEQ
jgi:predicted phage-related endonuclease